MLPLAPLAFPLTCPAMRPRGVGAVCHDADESAMLARLEAELEAQVSAAGCRVAHVSSFPFLCLALAGESEARAMRGATGNRGDTRWPWCRGLDYGLTLLCVSMFLFGSQRAAIRTAYADTAPLGQKTVRGSLTEMMQDDPADDEAGRYPPQIHGVPVLTTSSTTFQTLVHRVERHPMTWRVLL